MKNYLHVRRRAFAVLLAGALTAIIMAQPARAGAGPDRMPITTNSPEARAFFDQGIVAWENLHIPQALQCWQEAIRKDPNFMLAHLYVSERIPDRDQPATERKKDLALMDSVTPDARQIAA